MSERTHGWIDDKLGGRHYVPAELVALVNTFRARGDHVATVLWAVRMHDIMSALEAEGLTDFGGPAVALHHLRQRAERGADAMAITQYVTRLDSNRRAERQRTDELWADARRRIWGEPRTKEESNA